MSSIECLTCGSALVQPLKWQACDDGEVMVDLRCPECETCTQAVFTKSGVEALDREQASARRQLSDAYERVVAESMEALALCLTTALDLDLLGPDDFAPPRYLPAA